MLGAYTLRQGTIAFCLGQIVEVEIEYCETIIAWKQQLRFTRFACDVQCFVKQANCKFRTAGANLQLRCNVPKKIDNRRVLALQAAHVDGDPDSTT
jgi:hypothetical protein